MRIIKLKAENIKKLLAVEIAPTGNVVKITGKNGSGKTSVLDSIYWALGGSQNIQDEPIRRGEKKASVECDLGEMVVRRTFNEGGTTALTIENKDGLRFKSPQTMLDGLLGKLSFDPLEFMRENPREQFDTLRSLTGVDFSKLDAMRQKLYDERTMVNRDVKRLEVQVEGTAIPTEPAPVDAIEIDVSALVKKLTNAIDRGKERQKWTAKVEALGEQLDRDREEELSLEKQIQDLQQKLVQQRENIKDCQRAISETKEKAEGITVPDIAALQTDLKCAAEINKRKNEVEQAKKIKAQLKAELESSAKKAEDLTERIKIIDEEKASMIAVAKFPLDGLGFGNDSVIYNDLPLSQASSSEQLRVSMSIAMALNPKLKVIRITDGSLLDSNSMRIIEELASDNGYQVWMEVVDESSKVGIVIEDGRVAAVNE